NLSTAPSAPATKADDDEDAAPGAHATGLATPKNRLPGRITFDQETQEPERNDLIPASDQLDDDDVIPLSKTPSPDAAGPLFMSYCVDEGDVRVEMPYAEGNLGQLDIEESVSLFGGALELKARQMIEAKPGGHGSLALSF